MPWLEGRSRMPGMKPILILGIGNILLCDEGVGVRVVERLQGQALPEQVEAMDGGTGGIDLIELMAGRATVIVIDAIQADVEPGAVLRFTDADLEPQAGESFSLHDLGLTEALTMARHLGCPPGEVVIFGIKPKDVSAGLELSPEVAAVVPRVIELALAEARAAVAKLPPNGHHA